MFCMAALHFFILLRYHRRAVDCAQARGVRYHGDNARPHLFRLRPLGTPKVIDTNVTMWQATVNAGPAAGGIRRGGTAGATTAVGQHGAEQAGWAAFTNGRTDDIRSGRIGGVERKLAGKAGHNVEAGIVQGARLTRVG